MDDEKKSDEKYLVFQVGTLNWQCPEEMTSGSGVLHEAHHIAMNAMENVVSYSIWPSLEQKNADIPKQAKGGWKILEEEGPVAIRDSLWMTTGCWHKKTQAQVDDYLKRLESLLETYMDEAEAKEGCNVSLVISHHIFINSVAIHNVLKRRKAKGLSVPQVAAFAHGTSMKMMQNELNKVEGFEGTDTYEARFHGWITEMQLLARATEPTFVNMVWAISEKNAAEFKLLFPDFADERLSITRNGINTSIFNPIPELTPDIVLKDLTCVPMGSTEATEPIISADTSYDTLIVFVGKLVWWKRIEALLHAASIYEGELGRVATVVVGAGPDGALGELLALNAKLKNQHVYFLGLRMQPVLARLYSAAAVGVFPSFLEPFGMVLIECMMCGTPVISAKSGGPIDFVTPEVGVLVEDVVEQTADVGTVTSEEALAAIGKDLAASVVTAVKDSWKTTKRAGCLKLATGYTVGAQCASLLELAKSFE